MISFIYIYIKIKDKRGHTLKQALYLEKSSSHSFEVVFPRRYSIMLLVDTVCSKIIRVDHKIHMVLPRKDRREGGGGGGGGEE